jgi:hypothetical protein
MEKTHSPFPSKTATKRWDNYLKWLILVASILFLSYKLLTFNRYDELAYYWQHIPFTRFYWLIGVFAFMPLNWMFEAIKWKKLTSRIESLTLKTSLKAVLAGMSTGFFTPNRVGELVGRILFLKPPNRKSGATMSIVNSLTQNLVMIIWGVPACLVFFTSTTGQIETEMAQFILVLISVGVLLGVLYYALPTLSQRLTGSNISEKIGSFITCLSAYSKKDLSQIIGISSLRYFVFVSQFYFMLRFFNVQLELWQAFISIPASYLFVTFTPSVAFSEAAIRSSYAVLFVGAFSGQILGITLAGVSIWAVNYIIPIALGVIAIMRRRN